MNNIIIEAKGKINISLDVISKRLDGYHNLKMIMQTIGLADEVEIEKSSEMSLETNSNFIPKDQRNIAWKAANSLLKYFNINEAVKIKINKKIPVAAGLAGGSTDAAAVLKGINLLFKLGLDDIKLREFGGKLGADVPYCIIGGTMLAEGIGEILTPVDNFGKISIILVKPLISVSTQWVYKNLKIEEISNRPDTEKIINLIKQRDVKGVAENMVNVLEAVTIKRYPVIEKIKGELKDFGADGSLMSGSGPTVFGIFSDKEKAKYCFNKIKNGQHSYFLTETV